MTFGRLETSFMHEQVLRYTTAKMDKTTYEAVGLLSNILPYAEPDLDNPEMKDRTVHALCLQEDGCEGDKHAVKKALTNVRRAFESGAKAPTVRLVIEQELEALATGI
jgi:hypothetical protein